jgi:hypothetical protein
MLLIHSSLCFVGSFSHEEMVAIATLLGDGGEDRAAAQCSNRGAISAFQPRSM